MTAAQVRPMVGRRVVVMTRAKSYGGDGSLTLKRVDAGALVLADKHGAERAPIPLRHVSSVQPMAAPG